MKMQSKLAAGLLALAAFLPLAPTSGFAQAQQPAAVADPRIDGFDVEPVAQLNAGSELLFTLYGSPGGTATVRVGGSTTVLMLPEVEAGVYEGTYTISRRDRLTPDSTVTANLRAGNKVATSILDESLIAGASARWPGGNGGAAPRIDRFEVNAPNRLVAGEEMIFTLAGTPGGTASARIDGVKGKLALEETTQGVYEGAYTVKNRDKIAANTVVTGNLRVGKQERSTVLNQPLVAVAATQNSSSQRARAQRVAAPAPVCANCGVIEAINVVETKGDGSYLGMVVGGVAGAVLGNQVGHGTGTTIATVLGAAGGGFAGNEVEKRMKTTSHYEVIVRLENGATQMVSYPAAPPLRIGSRVKVENGVLVQI